MSSSLKQLAYQHLRTRLLSGALPPGQRISAYDSAKELGISQTPVREAIGLLESEGLVHQIPKLGVFVRRPDRREIAELYDLRILLEGFAATFLTPDAARASLHARIEADLRATSTTDRRIDALVAEASRLRAEYGVPTGFQRSTFFDVQTDRFALLAVDTGVMRVVDPAQEAWLEAALQRARGKTKMAILGHPFYAGGHDTSVGDEGFERLREQLRRHGVAVVMAGDTHDLEYYLEPAASGRPPVHHFVNGGGGAYLSFGTSLAWPKAAPTPEWAYYPARLPVMQKIDAMTPWWKRPAWWWTDRFAAWPFSAEWLSAAFDYNVAPFFQSFLVVRVEPTANRIVIVPYGVHDRLRWRDLDRRHA